ncbi:MAG: hypothetical protein EOO24_14245 [Comamonadaceae bacterium]|nr:MAG: hypothetical protein EOO24_14245 [Comamonadaceae bacterium]
MSQQAAQRIESGLAGARAARAQGELAQMHTQLVHTLDALAEVTGAGMIPVQERTPIHWDEPAATRLLWQVLARLRQEQCHAFPYAGTLLGLERDGRLLPGDKDADLGVWLEDFALAGRVLQDFGLQRATDVPPFDNMGTWVEAGSGLSVDLFGLLRDPVREHVRGGLWLYGRPPGWQGVLHLPWFGLVEKDGPAGSVWWPDAPDTLLQAIYGDWRTPRPEWESHVSNRALQELNLSWHCWALQSLCDRWVTGDLPSTLRLLEQIAMRCGDTPELLAWRKALAPGTR